MAEPDGAPNTGATNGAGKPQLFSSPLTPMRLAAVSDNPVSVPDEAPDDALPDDALPTPDEEPAAADVVIAAEAPELESAPESYFAPYEIPGLFADEATGAMPAVADATPDVIPAEATDTTAIETMPDEAPGMADMADMADMTDMALAEAANEGAASEGEE